MRPPGGGGRLRDRSDMRGAPSLPNRAQKPGLRDNRG